MLYDFLSNHRQELIERTRRKIALRAAPRPTSEELATGVPLFLTQLGIVLKQEATQSVPDGSEMWTAATHRGGELLKQGFSIGQAVHDYGDICQAITELASDLNIPFATEEFQTLNRCLDNAIASAVTEYARQHDVDVSGAEVRRLGFFAHELRNHLNTAVLALQAVKSGRVGVTGSTVSVLERSLQSLRHLIDRSVSEVRLGAGTHQRQRFRVAEFLEEMEIDASTLPPDRGLKFSIERVDNALLIDVDRQLFASAIANVLQNAFKFTRPFGHVLVRVRYTADRVAIEIEDECGGLLPGVADAVFRPFEQRGGDRSGMGLGLVISRRAIEADGGTISLRDIPGKGCVFTVEMPLVVGDPVGA